MLDTLRPILYTFATVDLPLEERPIPGVLLATKSTISITLCFTIAAANDGKAGLRQACPSRSTVWKLLPIATLSTLANIFSVYALDEIDAATFKLLMQLGLIITAGMSFLVLGRRYSSLQLQALAFALVAVIAFFISRTEALQAADSSWESMERAQKDKVDVTTLLWGGAWTLACLTCSGLSSVLGERFMVRDSRAYYIQKGQMEYAGLPCTFIATLPAIQRLYSSGRWSGLFVGWSWRLNLAIAQWVAAAWLTGLVIKRLSALVKKLMQCASAVLTYVISVWLGWLTPTAVVSLNALLVIQAVMFFCTAPTRPAAPYAKAAPAAAKGEVEMCTQSKASTDK